mmetsp:Transcript_49840/g.113498  ORF Transcript_49840/g.113498 Transcript_49840/m.113498 type:complete len:162 (-) Transcript_49840:168-653(-)
MPTGVTVPFSKMSEATRRARATGQTVSVDVDDQAQPTGASEAAGATTLHRGGAAWDTTMSRKSEHRQRMSSGGGGSANEVTGDGMRPTHQPVDEVGHLVAMLPYAFCILAVAVVIVICVVGRMSKMVSAESSSYFQDGKMADHKQAPKGAGGMGKVGFRRY